MLKMCTGSWTHRYVSCMNILYCCDSSMIGDASLNYRYEFQVYFKYEHTVLSWFRYDRRRISELQVWVLPWFKYDQRRFTKLPVWVPGIFLGFKYEHSVLSWFKYDRRRIPTLRQWVQSVTISKKGRGLQPMGMCTPTGPPDMNLPRREEYVVSFIFFYLFIFYLFFLFLFFSLFFRHSWGEWQPVRRHTKRTYNV